MPVPASASSRLGAPFAALGRKHLRHRFGHRPLALARLGAGRSAGRASLARLGGATVTVRGGGRSAASSHSSAARTACARPARAARAARRPAAPSPSRAGEASRSTSMRPRARASRDHRASPAAARRWRRNAAAASASLGRRLEPERPAQARHGRHREPRRMDEREQLQQVEPAQIRIAEPLADQRRVEDDVRGFGGAGDRFAPARLAHLAVRRRQPDAGMGCVQRGKGQRSGHPPTLPGTRTEEQRIWTPKRSVLPLCRPKPGRMRKRASC